MPGDQDASRGSLYLALVVANTTVPPIVYHTVTAEAVAAIPTQAETRADSGERLGALFDAHHQRLYRLARRLSRSAEDARDVVQDTFLRAARTPASVPVGMPNEEAWLVRGDAARPLRPPDVAAAVVARALVRRALASLPPRRRAIVVLHELEGAGISEIARLLGVAAVTVRWHLARGRRDMARTIETLGEQR